MAAPLLAVTPQPQRAYPIHNGKIPRPEEGPRALPVVFALAGATMARIGLSLADYHLAFVQSMFVDNSANAQALTVTFPETGQIVVIPKNSQGFVPVLFSGLNLTAEAATTGGVNIPVKFLNIPMDLAIWSSV